MHIQPVEIQKNVPLKPFTTFKIGGEARYFARCSGVLQLKQALEFAAENKQKVLLLGGSSNMLISDHGFEGLVISVEILGKEVLVENSEHAQIKLSAGENWDQAVAWACENEWWGLENLSHIPGKAGAAAVQNIGAYGAQISDCLESVEVLEISSMQVKNLSAPQCEFGYRKSIFNSSRRGEYVILSLVLRLGKLPKPNLAYADLQKYFAVGKGPKLFDIRKAVIEIRNKKFPFPEKEIGGNAGSFFKNFVLDQKQYSQLENKFSENFTNQELTRLLEYKHRFLENGKVKISSAFVIEACGWKGRQMGNVKVNETQSLVLLNMGGATGEQVLVLAKAIRQDVYKKTGLILDLEPELVGFSEPQVASFLNLF